MDWSAARGRLALPPFAPLAPALSRLDAHRWPTHEDITAIASHVVTARGGVVRFVMPREHTDRERRYYELRIADSGEIETRPRNWHDLFNALAWIAFPRAKAAINAQHAAILDERGEAEAKRRSPERDALTVFDEGGVVVASSSQDVFRLIVDFEWKELFWRRRAELEATTRFFAFGHALHEKFLEPFIGMVAKTVFMPVDAAFTSLDVAAQVARADEFLARHFSDRANFARAKLMAPMPVLGIPGWHSSTSDESFYDDPVHFRKQKPRA
ncbi:MAG TPA: DUF3025 domain-containing protein [Usitatibacter sp.]|nr:DUF3025 domain-containing protein [Usitatibacter sp.]